MKLSEYIADKYDTLYRHILKSGVPRHLIDEEEMELWILNNENMYNEAIYNRVEDI